MIGANNNYDPYDIKGNQNGGYPGHDDVVVFEYPDFVKDPDLAFEYSKISTNTSKPMSEIEKEQEEWAKQHKLEEEYRNYTLRREKERIEFFNSVEELANNLKQFFDNSKNIVENKNSSYKEMLQNIQNLFNSYTVKERKIIDDVLRVYGGNHHFPVFSSCTGPNPGVNPGESKGDYSDEDGLPDFQEYNDNDLDYEEYPSNPGNLLEMMYIQGMAGDTGTAEMETTHGKVKGPDILLASHLEVCTSKPLLRRRSSAVFEVILIAK
ncbi:hypothetical protein OESDEN_09224 [Oesophagostomum dentatum]|uniref:SXP/RAL-2 family protein Ani s 5-like cation-binding domain-containing protein n=1 Tax=Oesophagostomum dentatum TaxID=61180 RepID=A0A0B1T538_OESDE|nr:hypothetical protein OESDEN_09224 [Oesophagostomum dentatum]